MEPQSLLGWFASSLVWILVYTSCRTAALVSAVLLDEDDDGGRNENANDTLNWDFHKLHGARMVICTRNVMS